MGNGQRSQNRQISLSKKKGNEGKIGTRPHVEGGTLTGDYPAAPGGQETLEGINLDFFFNLTMN